MNKLTIEQLKDLEVGDWVWLILKDGKGYYDQIIDMWVGDGWMLFKKAVSMQFYSKYGKTWLAYKNKEEAEGKEDIDSLAVENEVLKQDKENLERTIEEINEALKANGITIDSDGNIHDSRVKEAKKQTAKAIIEEIKGDMAIATYTFNPMLASELKTIYLRLEKEYGVEVDE